MPRKKALPPEEENLPTATCECCKTEYCYDPAEFPSGIIFVPCPNCDTRIELETGKACPLMYELRQELSESEDFADWRFCDFIHTLDDEESLEELGITPTPANIETLARFLTCFSKITEYEAFAADVYSRKAKKLEGGLETALALQDPSQRAIALGTYLAAFRQEAEYLLHRSKIQSFRQFVSYLNLRTGKDFKLPDNYDRPAIICDSLGTPIASRNRESAYTEHIELQGKEIVITGTLDKPRKEYADLIKAAGGKLGNAITNRTAYLVTGESPGRCKIDDANYRDIPKCTLATLKTALGIE